MEKRVFFIPTLLLFQTALANIHSPAPGTFKVDPIEHIIVLVQENHALDNVLGMLVRENHLYTKFPNQPYLAPTTTNPDGHWGPQTVDALKINIRDPHPYTIPFVSDSYPQNCKYIYLAAMTTTYMPYDPDHTWGGQHHNWNAGYNDLFGTRYHERYDAKDFTYVMSYFHSTQLPYSYWLADQFAIGDRYFSSVIGPTWPNRSYVYAATSYGITETYQEIPDSITPHTIFDLLNEYEAAIRASLTANNIPNGGIPLWGYYNDSRLVLPDGTVVTCSPLVNGDYVQQLYPSKHYPCSGDSDQFVLDVQNQQLPFVTFIDADYAEASAHPEDRDAIPNLEESEKFQSKIVNTILNSAYRNNTVIFITYDENGGYYDHVPPPQAVIPDGYPPCVPKEGGGCEPTPYQFNYLGFRVPFFAVSAWAKRHYVSHIIYDHTSLLKYIENKFTLPTLTERDAHANSLDDFLDFSVGHDNLPIDAPPEVVIHPNQDRDPSFTPLICN